MNSTLDLLIKAFRPNMNVKGGVEIWGVNRTIMAQFLSEMGFRKGVEVGTAEGNHAKVLLDTNEKLLLFCVDIYEKYRGYAEYDDPNKCFEEAKGKLDPNRSIFIKDYSINAVENFDDGELDFVYIDGGHDFANVAIDICEWSRKVKVGGIVFGHDYKRSTSKSRHPVHVKDVIDAYMYSHKINPWFVLKNDIRDATFGPDNPGWLFVRQESDQL